jgi:hypothetical protein
MVVFRGGVTETSNEAQEGLTNTGRITHALTRGDRSPERNIGPQNLSGVLRRDSRRREFR